jgi:heptosyltransferase II
LKNKLTKVLIELPTWLGDCVMSTPAIENIIDYYQDIDITVIGSNTSVEFLRDNPKVTNILIVDSKNKLLFRSFTHLGFFDAYFTFRSSVRATITKFIINAKNKYQFKHVKYRKLHQVEKYVEFVNDSLNVSYNAGDLLCYINRPRKQKDKRILGINPGASYGSAKRWYPEKFAKIAIELSNSFDILIFGGINELEFANIIEKYLVKDNIHNFVNLAGKTSVLELTKHIGNLDIFITGDSGPMHIAASLKIPTISLFGPTNPIETSQWNNPNSFVIKKNLDCQPCMKRSCPLNHHNCMKLIEAEQVIDSISEIIQI